MGSLLRNGCAQVFNPTAPSPALHSTRCECHSAKLPAPGQRVVSPLSKPHQPLHPAHDPSGILWEGGSPRPPLLLLGHCQVCVHHDGGS